MFIKKNTYFTIHISIFFFFTISLTSCSSEAGKVEMEIVTFSNFKDTTSTTYPSDIIEIARPLESKNFSSTNKNNTGKTVDCKTDFGFAPLFIKRVDLDDFKIPLDYLNNKGLSYSKINAIIKSYGIFFDSSAPDSRLNYPQKAFDLDGYLNETSTRPNVFFYSSSDSYTFGKNTIYHSTSELRDAIQLAICKKNLKKVVVLYDLKSPPKLILNNTSISLKCKSLAELRNALLSESNSKMFNKNYLPENVKLDLENFSFSCDLISQKSNFTKLSFAWGPLNSCESCSNVLQKNPGSHVIYEAKDKNMIYNIIAVQE